MGDGQSDRQQLPYRLSKGLRDSHLTSGDRRTRPLPTADTCTACGQPIPPGASVMWLDDAPYHVKCGQSETTRRDAAALAERRRRLRG
jgi:hypothetical protein